MSTIGQSRGDLYEKYKKNDPELAKAFLGDKYEVSSTLSLMGIILLVSAVATSIIVISIVGSVTHGFGPAIPGFQTMFSLIGGVGGTTALAGLVTLAIAHCKKRAIMAERLAESQIEAMINQNSIPMKTITTKNT